VLFRSLAFPGTAVSALGSVQRPVSTCAVFRGNLMETNRAEFHIRFLVSRVLEVLWRGWTGRKQPV